MKYTIQITGEGADNFIFKLSENQRQKLWDADVESGNVDQEEICEILEIETIFETDDNFIGLYIGENHGEHLKITVLDSSDHPVWESNNQFNFKDFKMIEQYSDGEYLLIEDFQKGHFFDYTLESDTQFNPDLLSCKIVNLLDGVSQVITQIQYAGVNLDYDYIDTSSKGFTYYLS
jgi:hypothetical protein